MTTSEPTFGPMLRAWRAARGKSQLALALEAGVSTRHLSFVETGRSTPSREMILALAETLDVPLRERNALLEAAGFAAIYRETPLDAPAMADAKDALGRILDSHLPNPALALNRRSDVLLANTAATRVIAHFAPEYRGKMNVVSLLVGGRGLRKAIVNWREVTSHVVHRCRNELAALRAKTADDEAVLAEIAEVEKELDQARALGTRPPAILIPMKLRDAKRTLELYTMIATLGTPLDITLQELRIETLFAVDETSRAALVEIVSTLPPR